MDGRCRLGHARSYADRVSHQDIHKAFYVRCAAICSGCELQRSVQTWTPLVMDENGDGETGAVIDMIYSVFLTGTR